VAPGPGKSGRAVTRRFSQKKIRHHPSNRTAHGEFPGTNRHPPQKKFFAIPFSGKKFPRENAPRRASRPVKKIFQLFVRTPRHRFLRVKSMKNISFSAPIWSGTCFLFLSTKKITQKLREKIDGNRSDPISCGLGFGSPHPVVVSNV